MAMAGLERETLEQAPGSARSAVGSTAVIPSIQGLANSRKGFVRVLDATTPLFPCADRSVRPSLRVPAELVPDRRVRWCSCPHPPGDWIRRTCSSSRLHGEHSSRPHDREARAVDSHMRSAVSLGRRDTVLRRSASTPKARRHGTFEPHARAQHTGVPPAPCSNHGPFLRSDHPTSSTQNTEDRGRTKSPAHVIVERSDTGCSAAISASLRGRLAPDGLVHATGSPRHYHVIRS